MRRAIHLLAALVLPLPAAADPAQILDASASPTGETWQISVTIRHDDTGWDDYADGWRVETADGTVLALRELLHPHVDEQPFTRSVSSVTIPAGTRRVHIRSRTSTTGWSAQRSDVALP